MKNKLYVGNLSYNTTEEELSELFADSGEVTSCRIIRDRDSGRSKGFGFIEMSSPEMAQSALDGLNGTDFHDRPLRISFAREREDNNRGGGGRGGRFDRPRRGGPRSF